MGKDFLMKLPFHSENVEEEEYLFLLKNKLPSILSMQKKKKKKKIKNIFSSSVNGETNIRAGKDFLMKVPFHSMIVEEEEYFLFFWKCRG